MNQHNSRQEQTESLTLVEAVQDGLRTEMELNDNVVLLGEDIGTNGGVFRATDGLLNEFGPKRVIDTPLAEAGIVGSAIGMASDGFRPVAEIQFMGFIYPAFDQIVSHAARLRTRSRGRITCPLVVRAPYGGGIRPPEHHSESSEALFVHTAGLKVAIPSNPRDSKGLLIQAIRDPDPVIFLEPKKYYRSSKGEVPTCDYTIPFGNAVTRREGSDISVFTWGAMTHPTIESANNLSEEGIDVEVIDLRTLSPLDESAIINSFEKTGRGAVVQEAPKTGGFAAELISTLQENSLLYQEAPIKRITGFDVPFPLHSREDYYLPDPSRISDGIIDAINF